MTAVQQQRQRVIPLRQLLLGSARYRLAGGDQRSRGLLTAPARVFDAQLIGQPPGGDGDQPAPGMLRHPFPRPLRRRRQERLLHRLLAEIEVAVAANEDAEDPRRQIAQQILDGSGHVHISVPA